MCWGSLYAGMPIDPIDTDGLMQVSMEVDPAKWVMIVQTAFFRPRPLKPNTRLRGRWSPGMNVSATSDGQERRREVAVPPLRSVRPCRLVAGADPVASANSGWVHDCNWHRLRTKSADRQPTRLSAKSLCAKSSQWPFGRE